jgi:hypothetical protein
MNKTKKIILGGAITLFVVTLSIGGIFYVVKLTKKTTFKD